MLRIGLTGGIGSGKTTVANYFSRLGIDIIDADEIVHRISTPGHPVFDRIVQAFGSKILASDGTLIRQKLRAIVFDSETMRKKLEAILHPAVRESMQLALENVHSPYCILVIPLLVETGFDDLVDRVLVVSADRERRIDWVRERSGLTAAQIESIMTTQASDAQRKQIADDVIENNSSLDELYQQLGMLDQKYRNLAKESS